MSSLSETQRKANSWALVIISQILISAWLTLRADKKLSVLFTLATPQRQLTIWKTTTPSRSETISSSKSNQPFPWRVKSPQTSLTPPSLRWAITFYRTSSRLCSSPSPSSFITTRARERARWRTSRDHQDLLQTERPAVLEITVPLHQKVKGLIAHALMRQMTKCECCFPGQCRERDP